MESDRWRMILITEAELAELRRRATEPDARVADLIEASKQTERYAGQLETALERIRVVCRLARGSDAGDLHDALDLISGLALVKDDRTTIGVRHLFNAQKQG